VSSTDDTSIDTGLFDGRYRFVRRLGSGGMARVFLADDVVLHRQVAIKILSDGHADDAQFVERFQREARAAAGLNHQNIVAIYDRGEADGSYYIAMEYLDGETLKDVIAREGPMAPRRAIDISLQVLAALHFAHRRDVIHRDVKPHNIMVLRDGRVKVMDFGIARAGESEMTEAGSIVGTAQYLSPEQARGQAVGPPSDLYSMGCVLYEMLTGRVPFTGDSAVAIAMKHVQEPPVPPRRIDPSIPPELEQVVMRAMAKDPMRRYQTAAEMGMDLDRIRKGAAPAAATAVMAAGGAYAASQTMVAPPPVPPDAATRPPSQPPPRRTWPWLLAIILGIIVAALAGWLFFDLGNNSKGGGSGTTAATVAVQDVRGFSAASAASALQKQGLVVDQAQAFSDKPQGTVADQNPPAGTVVDVGSTVTITISKGQDLVAVDDVTGKTYDAAKSILTGNDFKVKKKSQSDDTIPKNQVISQDPPGGTQAQRGSEVVLVVSSGPAAVTVPPLINVKQADATAQLTQLGLQTAVVQAASTVYKEGRVSAQDPAAGQQVAKGSTVTITVSTGPPPVTMPDVTGKTQASAEAELTNDGLKFTTETVPVTDPSQDGIVQATDPVAGTSVKPGSTVVLQVGHFGP
jgi:serine/threonine-protein kinase